MGHKGMNLSDVVLCLIMLLWQLKLFSWQDNMIKFKRIYWYAFLYVPTHLIWRNLMRKHYGHTKWREHLHLMFLKITNIFTFIIMLSTNVFCENVSVRMFSRTFCQERSDLATLTKTSSSKQQTKQRTTWTFVHN